MKIIIAKAALWRELALLQQNVLDKKGTIPALSHIRLKATGKRRLGLTGTDLDVTLTGEIEATVKQAGTCVLPGRKLFDIVKNLPDEPITIALKANCRAEITCGRSQFKMAGLSPDDYPELPKFKETSAHLPASVARRLIERTRFAITNDESRYALAGARFTLSDKGTRMVTTDGHRLALAENKAAVSETELACLIPKKALSALAQLAAGHEGEIGLHLDDNHLYAEIGARTLVCRLLSGEFPAYEKIFPSGFAQTAMLSGGVMLEAVRRVAIMAEGSARGVCLEFTPGQLRLYTPQSAEGAAEDILTVEYAGPLLTVGLNAQYLAEYLATLGGGPLVIAFNAPDAVVQFQPQGEAECDSLSLLMPVALPQAPAEIPAAPVAAEPAPEAGVKPVALAEAA